MRSGSRTIAPTILVALLLLAGSALAMSTACDPERCVTHHDVIPNFAGHPTIQSTRSGPWSDPATWAPTRVPTAADVVTIGAGTLVTVDTATARAKVVGIAAGGRLAFATGVSTRLTVGTLLVLPQGELAIGTEAAPISPGAVAELVIADQALDVTDDGTGTYDPQQYGTGLLSVDGRVRMHGAVKTPYARLATEPRAGDLVLRLAEPAAGWRAGDRLFLPDSKHYAIETVPYVYEGEEMSVASISADGLAVTLAAPLRFTHPGARDGNGVLEFLPHVGNAGRNVIVRSEAPAGTRGHILLTGRSDVDVRYAALRNLGRTTIDPLDSTTFDSAGHASHLGTNQIGRYPLHIHHLIGPSAPPASGYQWAVVGNAVDDDAAVNRRKWGITVHGSHYGLVRDNVVYNAGGWGIGTEDGSESYNVFERNLVARVRGEGGRANSEGGLGFWLRGPNNYVRDNSVANVMGNSAEAARGYEHYFVYLGDICVPVAPGADPAEGQCTTVNGNALPLLEFARNEVYGPTEIGLSIWWLGTLDTSPLPVAESVVKDFRVWHHSRYGYYGYPANRLTFDGFVARGNKAVISNRYEFILGIWFGDYMNQDVLIRNADIQNLRTGIVAPYFMRGRTTIADSYLRNATNVSVVTIGAPGSAPFGPNMPPKETVIDNVRFETVAGPVGGDSQWAIAMDYDLHNGSANLVQRDAVFVYDFDGIPGDDFQLFYNEQRPDFVVPQSSGNLAGSPEAGLTNAQNWAKYGIAIAGLVATGAASRPDIYGLARAGAPPPPDLPPSITNQPIGRSVTAGQSATFSVSASGTAPLSYQWQKNGADITGATKPSYTIPAATAADNGAAFRCAVSNSAGTAMSDAAVLTVTGPPPRNRAPSVSAGGNQSVVFPATAALAGSASDDGLPASPGVLALKWTKVLGPGTVAFADASALTTTATFAKAGIYVLKLTASDGALTSAAFVTVTVRRR